MTAASVFDPAKLPLEGPLIAMYGLQEIKVLADFYGSEATVEYQSTVYTSPPLLDGQEVLSEWKTFKRAFAEEKKNHLTKYETQPNLQDICC